MRPKTKTAKCTWVLSGRRDGSTRTFCGVDANPEPVRLGQDAATLCPRHEKMARVRYARYGKL
jgi:hypothetical protein